MRDRITVVCKQPFFLRFFSGNFLFSFDNFKTTGRMTLLFFLWESPESGECFTYPAQVFEIGFGISTARRSWRVGLKSIRSQKFPDLPDLLFKFFFRKIFIFLQYFQNYTSHDSTFFIVRKTWVWRVFYIPSSCMWDWFWRLYSAEKLKS